MAESPAHRFGQQVGDFIQALVEPILAKFCVDRGLELDSKNRRIVAGRGRKVTWQDLFGNSHDLDYVIVRPSKEVPEGRPIAFIEVAWRRYTKHSRNKAQEIQGAVLPIAQRYSHDRPFLGAVLAGVFTEGSLQQLESVGFRILLLPYDSIVDAFASIGLDVRFDESTSDAVFAQTVKAVDAVDERQRSMVTRSLLAQNQGAIDAFFADLRSTIDRRPFRILVVPLHGRDFEFETVDDAVSFLSSPSPRDMIGPLRRYDIIVTFTNGDRIEGVFADVANAVRFLKYVQS